jgi:hydrogenase-4 component B
VLVACCFFIGLAPSLIAPALAKGIAAWDPTLNDPLTDLVTLAPLNWITGMGLSLIAMILLCGMLLRFRIRQGGVVRSVTWGCGYLAPTPRIQYTSSSFGQMLVGLFAWALRPHIHRSTNLSLFPQHADFHSEVDDTVLDEAVLPTFRFAARLFSWFRVFQQGNIQTYLLYIFIALVALLLWP